MAKLVGMAAVTSRIKVSFDEYEREVYKIFKYYAAEMLSEFMQIQGKAPAETKGAFWTNHTFKAVEGWFAKAWQVPGEMGITLANETWYSVLLELDHDMRFASFPYFMKKYEPMIIHDIRVLYGEI